MSLSDRPTRPNRRRGATRRSGERRQAGERRVAPDPRNRRTEEDPAFAHLATPGGVTSVTGTIGVRSSADRVAITPDGAFAYVQHANDGTVSLVRTADNSVVVTIGPGASPLRTSVRPQPVSVATEPSAETQIQGIGIRLRGLVASGVLKIGWVDAFLAKLDAATEQLRKGNPMPATSVLEAFVHQVVHFESVGILSPAQAIALRFAAQEAIRQIGA